MQRSRSDYDKLCRILHHRPFASSVDTGERRGPPLATADFGRTIVATRERGRLASFRSSRAWLRPRSAYHIGVGAFSDTTNPRIVIPARAAVRRVRRNAFAHNNVLVSVTFRVELAPAAAALLAFHHRVAHAQVPPDDSVPFIDALSSEGVRRTIVGYVAMESALRSIGQYALGSCYRLTTLILPEGLETIEAEAFALCWPVMRMRLLGRRASVVVSWPAIV